MSRMCRSLVTILAVLSLSIPVFAAGAEKAKDDRVVKDGMMISLEYTLKGNDGKVIESSKGKEPLKYIHGQKMMIPGLEKELTGMKVGGEKNVRVKPEDGYGKIDPQAFQEVPKEKIPANGLKVGAILTAKTPDGGMVPMRVHEIKEKTVVMDMNHPMAGRTLDFNVKVVDIQPPSQPPAAQPVKPAAPAQPIPPTTPAKPADPAKK